MLLERFGIEERSCSVAMLWRRLELDRQCYFRPVWPVAST